MRRPESGLRQAPANGAATFSLSFEAFPTGDEDIAAPFGFSHGGRGGIRPSHLLRHLAIATLYVLATVGCRREQSSNPAASMSTNATTVDMRHQAPQYGVVLYFAPDPLVAPEPLVESLISTNLPGVHLWRAPVQPPKDNWPKPPFLAYTEEFTPLKTLPVPDEGHLAKHGHGLAIETSDAIQHSSRACRLMLFPESGSARDASQSFSQLVHAMAERTEAVIFDSSTYECFSPQAWKARRLDTWTTDGIPDVRRFLFLEAYLPEPGSPVGRALTYGMRRFALPDLSVGTVPQRHANAVKLVLQLVAQSLVERPEIPSLEDVTFSIATLRSPFAREGLQKQLGPGGTGNIRLRLVDVETQPGDPNNAMIELDFAWGTGRTDLERQEDLLGRFMGTSLSSYLDVERTPELEAASRRAREQWLKWGPDFRKHFPAGSTFMAKGPFPHDDGSDVEWMWIEVLRWNDAGELEGVLANDPVHIRRFQSGARVKFPAGQIYDYEVLKPDGTRQGNETGRLMEQQRK